MPVPEVLTMQPMTLLPHTSSPSVQIRSGIGMAVSLTGMRVHEPLELPDCTVSLQMLKFALDNAPDGFASKVTASHLELSAHGFSTKIPLLVEEPLPEPELHQRFTDLDFTALRRLSACCSQHDVARPVLEYVCLSGSSAAAATGKVFALAGDMPCDELEIHRSHLAVVGDGIHPVSVSPKSVCVQTSGGTLWLPRPASSMNLVEGCKRLLEHVSGSVAAVKTEDVISALKTASQIVEKIEVQFLSDGIQIHTPDNAAYFSQRIIAKTSAEASVAVNPKFLLSCLQAVGEEFVDLFISQYGSVAVKGQKTQAVCMGMRKT